MEGAREIGGNWVEVTDPDSGDVYYYNTETEVTQWEYPEDIGGEEEAPGFEAERVWGNWMSARDPDSGAEYFFNQETGVTQWEMPEGFDENAVPATEQQEAGEEEKPLEQGEDAAKEEEETTEKEPTEKKEEETPGKEPAERNEKTEVTQETSKQTDGAAGTATSEDKATEDSSKKAEAEPKSEENKASGKKEQEKNEDTSDSKDKTDKFEKLKNFKQIGEQRKQELREKQKREEEERKRMKEEAEKEENDERNKSTWGMARAEVPHPGDIANKAMEEYAEEYFNLNRKGMFGKKTTLEKVLAWKPETIKKSLRNMPDKDTEQQALQCFRNVTGFMGDRSTNKEEGGHAEKLLKVCLEAPEDLRDEVYCQIIKQTTNNPSNASLLRGWQLMAICSGAFPPSSTLEPFLMSYCNQHRDEKDGIGELAKFTMGQIRKGTKLGPRSEVPHSMEILACMHTKPVFCRIHHLDGSSNLMPVASWMTVADLNDMMAHELGILNADGFAIFEMTPENEERRIESNVRVLDLISYWQRFNDEEKMKKNADVVKQFRLVYKVHMYFDPPEDDTYAQQQLYRQAVYDVISGRYPTSDKEMCELASVQIQVEYGDRGVELTKDNIWRFVPDKDKDADDERKQSLIDRINKARIVVEGKDKFAAQKFYLDTVKSWKMYGSSFFFVEPQMSVTFPDEVFLAINPRGILVIKPETKEVLKEYAYSEVPTWGHSGSSFVLHIGDLQKQDKHYFQTDQGKEINELIRGYVERLANR